MTIVLNPSGFPFIPHSLCILCVMYCTAVHREAVHREAAKRRAWRKREEEKMEEERRAFWQANVRARGLCRRGEIITA